ncbi:MAG TPA: PKD domain-containing protein [Gemmatimonadaceae bacterium]|nr:PKD domain-containing protein [Gemmatimonadaceae bacterium]
MSRRSPFPLAPALLAVTLVASAACHPAPTAPEPPLASLPSPTPTSPAAIDAGCSQDERDPGHVHCLAASREGPAPAAVEWDMGDGSVAGGLSLSYSYGEPGSYTIRIRARGTFTATPWRTVATLDVEALPGDAQPRAAR